MVPIASRAAILRAAKAAPGAAQPTYPPQGGSPWIGQLPSYSTEPGSGYDYSRYGPFLPRPARTFTEGAFGPFSPILPVPVDQPPPGEPRAQPRRFDYQVGWNLPTNSPGTDGYRLASFQTLRSLADTYSILRTCLERRKNEIRALDWDITLTSEAAKAYQGDRKAFRDFGERRAQAMKFFKRPDPDYFTFASWLHAVMDQVFTYDALSVYMCAKRGRGTGNGLLGSDLDSLWLLDGSTIRPLLGLHGETPKPPAVSYQQYIAGVPRTDLATMASGLDLAEFGLSQKDVLAELRSDQLIYYPYLRRAETPYGFSLVEQCLIPIMTGLRKQAYQLDFFNENTTPRVYISPGDTTMTPNQVRELQDALNAVAGDISWSFKIQVLPPGSKVMPQKEMEIVDQADEWIANEVAMTLDISPMEIGLLPKVSTVASPFAAREMAQASRSIHERTATKPTLSYLCEIFDTILQVVCGQDDMRFVFEGMEETQDVAALIDSGIKTVQSGVKSIDEVRDDLHLPPWGLPETSGPIVLTQMGPVPLGQAASDTVSQIREAITGAHESAQGHQSVSSARKPPKMLPAGTSGQGRMNGPVTQRQARRGGALAPAHAMAEGSPGHSGASAPRKAVLAELEALQRHLNKGLAAGEWVPVHIPGAVMATITDDLASGLSAAYAVRQAVVTLGKAPAHPGQQRQAQIAQRYRQQVRQAFNQALARARALITAWIAGTLAVTAAVLAQMIIQLIQIALLAILTALWTAAWDAAVKAAGGDPAKLAAGLQAFIDSHGAQWADLISSTGTADLLDAITSALRAGDAAAVEHQLADVLDTENRSEMIAVSETTRAWNAGTEAAMRQQGLAYWIWRNRGDDRVCAACKAKTALGPWPAGKPYPDGTVRPPGHPRCRCWMEPSAPPGAKKMLRRQVGLNGQETYVEWEPDPDYSGGRTFQPHLSDGTQWPVQGTMPQPEFPRWDGSEPEPVVEHAPDADDSAAYGSPAGLGARPGTYWPAPYMDGYWPRPGNHDQAPVTSIGAANGRPPNAAGKRKRGKAAEFLRTAPAAKATDVRKVMLANFPPAALGWVTRIRWAGPVDVPIELIDTSGRDTWAARHQQGHVDQLARDMSDGKPVDPVIGVIRAGHNHIRMIDGRHRLEAAAKLGRPVTAYIGYLDGANEQAAYDTYHSQLHSGDSPENKSFTAGNLADGSAHGLVPFNLLAGPDSHDHSALPSPPPGRPYCAGLAVRAADTGRILMLQRAVTEGDDGAGLLEFPGGHADPGESLLQAGMREWQEEVGQPVPHGAVTGHWESSNGVYAGFVHTIGSEQDLDLAAPRTVDNPDGDRHERAIWMDLATLGGNAAVRNEIRTDLPLLLAALSHSGMRQS